MISKENMKYSLRNLLGRKSRSILTIISIFVGITTIFIFLSFGLGLFNYIESFTTGSAADKLFVQAQGSGATGSDSIILDANDLREVEKTNGVIDATGAYLEYVEVERNGVRKYVALFGFDTSKTLFVELLDVDIFEGRVLKSKDAGKAVVGYNYLVPNAVFEKPFAIGDTIEANGEKLRIIGFYSAVGNPADDSNIYVIEDTMGSVVSDFEAEQYSWLIGRADIDEMEDVVDAVAKNLRQHRDEDEGKETFTVTSFLDQIESISSALNVVIVFILFIALISVIVSAINTANTMITSVLERVKEIGIIKSIGGKNSEIFNIFLFESSFLGLVAGIIGVFVGWVFAASAGAFLETAGWGFLQPYYTFWVFFGCVAFATIVGTISGVAPAINASKQKPVDALRYE
jgi:putative ABC transport system permease protein